MNIRNDANLYSNKLVDIMPADFYKANKKYIQLGKKDILKKYAKPGPTQFEQESGQK